MIHPPLLCQDVPEKPALIWKDVSFSYSGLRNRIGRYADIIHSRGAKRVAIISENRPEWVIIFYAAWSCGAVVIPVDHMLPAGSAAYILNDCKPELVFISPSASGQMSGITDLVSPGTDFMLIGDEPVVQQDGAEPDYKPAPNDTAVIIYTSGTTGSPKGVMLSFSNLIANIRAVSEEVSIFTPERQVLALLPLHHIFPLAGSMLAPLSIGATVVMSPSVQAADLTETLKNNSVAIIIGVPRLYEVLFNGINARIRESMMARLFYYIVKLSGSKALGRKIFNKVHQNLGGHLEILVTGGAALGKPLAVFFRTLGFEILEGYGMTEAAPMITFTRPGAIRPGSAGQPLPGMQVEIRDEEIVARGPNVMKGYLNRPDETREVIRDGWLHTGDMGRIDRKGYLWITGRLKEIIVLPNGKNINPQELEKKIEQHSKYIKEAAVFTEKQSLHVLIFPEYALIPKDPDVTAEAFFRNKVLPALNQNLPAYERITRFTLISTELPRTRLGKIQRFRLPELAGKPARPAASGSSPQLAEFEILRGFIRQLTNNNVEPTDHLEFDLALDSLGKISLIDFIEKSFGVVIGEDQLLRTGTVGELARYVSENKQSFNPVENPWSENLGRTSDVSLPTAWFTQGILIFLSRVILKLIFRLKGHGYKNIPEGPCIIAPNHQSFLDGLFVASYIRPVIMRNTYFFANKKHVNNRFLKWLADKNNVIVMDMNLNIRESVQKLAEVLRKGKKIIIFPEGTRTKTGRTGEFRRTFAILSTELNIPIVPVAINGAFRALPPGRHFPRLFTRVSVHFLPPVFPAEFTSAELASRVERLIRSRLWCRKPKV